MLKVYVLLVSILCYARCDLTSACDEKEKSVSYLDVAVEMIDKAKDNFPTCNCDKTLIHKAVDCADLLHLGHNKSGVYKIWPMNRLIYGTSIDVYCDMETAGGGWTVFQRRGDFKRPKDYFYKDWKSYKEGFGDIEEDFWLGNDNIFALTNQKLYSARFDMKSVEGIFSYAQYDKFWIDDENQQYTLHIADYSGDAGDSMIKDHDNSKFSTKDRENDIQPAQFCAQLYKGGWWYGGCHQANLNGMYLKGKHSSFADGINWNTWKGYHESLEWTEIKIRPKNFRSAKHFIRAQ